MEFLSNADIEKLSVSQRIDYYKELRQQCCFIKSNQLQIGQSVIKYIYPTLRQYQLKIEGEESIPSDSNVIFLVNHSNSHDIFTAYELLSYLGRRGSVMVATDCLNRLTTNIFNISNATLFDRRKKDDRKASIVELSNKILNGTDGVIFGEGTWNLHPILPMHNIRQGVSKISVITQAPIIPTIFEYVEKDGIIKSEGSLYKCCIIRFGKPMVINYKDSLIDQTNRLKQEMSIMRRQIWESYNIYKEKLLDIDPLIYINHTYLKKFKALGFTYDSKKEQEFLLFLNGEPKENEYHITDEGMFCPGITERRIELRKTKYK